MLEFYRVFIHNCKMDTMPFQFINEQFLFGSRPPQLNMLRPFEIGTAFLGQAFNGAGTRVFGSRKAGQESNLPVCRNRKPAENADPDKKGHL